MNYRIKLEIRYNFLKIAQNIFDNTLEKYFSKSKLLKINKKIN